MDFNKLFDMEITEDKHSQVNEPDSIYKKEVRIFHSFEEAEAYDLKQMAMKDPIQNIIDTVDLILRVYGTSREELINRIPDNKIRIIHYL